MAEVTSIKVNSKKHIGSERKKVFSMWAAKNFKRYLQPGWIRNTQRQPLKQ